MAEKEVQRAAIQVELDDLLMVFGDIEEKKMKYKVIRFHHCLKPSIADNLCDQGRLQILGEPVSDGEEEEGTADWEVDDVVELGDEID